MNTLTPAANCRHVALTVTTTRPTEFVDLTDRLEAIAAGAGWRTGLVNVQSLHTTTAIVVNEHEPLLLQDFEEFLTGLAPERVRYRHDDLMARTVNLSGAERRNGHAHCRALLLPASAGLNVVDGRLCLGRWQRVFRIELDGPRERDVSVLYLGEGRR